jgi:ATP-dependent Lon protease
MSREPAFASIACVGTIIEHVELPGERLHIVLRGRGRVRLEELPFSPPYRRARASWIAAEARSAADADLAALHHAAAGFARLIKKRDPGFSFRLPKTADPAEIADALTHQLVIDARSRQAVLEALDETRRIRLVTETLTVQLATLSDFHPDDSN